MNTNLQLSNVKIIVLFAIQPLTNIASSPRYFAKINTLLAKSVLMTIWIRKKLEVPLMQKKLCRLFTISVQQSFKMQMNVTKSKFQEIEVACMSAYLTLASFKLANKNCIEINFILRRSK